MMINLDKPSSGFLSVCGQKAAKANRNRLPTAIMRNLVASLPEWTVRETNRNDVCNSQTIASS